MAKKTVEKKHSTTDQDVDDPIKNGGDSYTAEDVERENSSKRENLRIKLVKGASFTRRGKIYTKGNPVYAAAEEDERLLNTGFFDRA